MRQLSALEKRLLRILAIQKQMSETGAVEDFSKTLDNTANELKQISELWKEIGRWMGTLFLDYLKPIISGLLTISIVIKEILKSLAIASGYTETIFKEGSGFDGLSDSVSSANDEIDKLTKKLLSFDKFEALNSSDNGVASDIELLVNSLASYSSVLSDISSKANQTAKSILEWLGYVQEVNVETGDVFYKLADGYTNLEKIRDILSLILSIGLTLLGSAIASKITNLIGSIELVNSNLVVTSGILKTIGTIGVVAGLFTLIKGLQDGNKALIVTGSILLTISATLKLIWSLNSVKSIFDSKLAMGIYNLTHNLGKLQSTLLGVGAGLLFVGAGAIIFTQMDKWSAKTKVIVGVLGTLVAVLTTATVAWLAFHGAMTLGTAVPIIIGAVTLGVASIVSLIKGVQQFADGGYPDKGSLFIANEKGPELVGNIGGRTAVANNDMIVQAIENASYRGIVRGLATRSGNKDNIEFDFSGTNDSALARLLAQPIINELQRQGYKIEKY